MSISDELRIFATCLSASCFGESGHPVSGIASRVRVREKSQHAKLKSIECLQKAGEAYDLSLSCGATASKLQEHRPDGVGGIQYSTALLSIPHFVAVKSQCGILRNCFCLTTVNCSVVSVFQALDVFLSLVLYESCTKDRLHEVILYVQG